MYTKKLPDLFCENKSKLILKAKLEISDKEGIITFNPGTIFIVDDIIGYGYNLKTPTFDEIIRIMNSRMPIYFDKPQKKGNNN